MFKKIRNRPSEVLLLTVSAAMPSLAHSPETVLHAVTEQLLHARGELSVFGPRLSRALAQEDWVLATRTLLDLVETAADLSMRLAPVRRDAVELAPAVVEDRGTVAWKDAAIALLENGIPALLPDGDPMVDRARHVACEVRQVDAGNDVPVQVAAFVASCSGHGATIGTRQDLLLEVLRQVVANVAVLSEQESWVHGQVASVETLLAGPMSTDLLRAAIDNLKDVAQRQAQIRESRDSTRESVERMLHAFGASLDTVVGATSQYHARIDGYSDQLASVQTAEQLHPILAGIRQETAVVKLQARAAREQVRAAHSELQEAQGRIQALESKLEQMSELAREDPLTKSLNRRGMMEALGREMHRARRYRIPLCIALLDIDNFKQLNDRLGHQAGDNALVHLVTVIRTTLRQMDVIARFGGEEFLLLLPSSNLEHAMQAVTRIQRELTRSIFMHKHQRVLVTFSAGAALVMPDETQENLIQRVDAALYCAKREGKNRVVAAD